MNDVESRALLRPSVGQEDIYDVTKKSRPSKRCFGMSSVLSRRRFGYLGLVLATVVLLVYFSTNTVQLSIDSDLEMMKAPSSAPSVVVWTSMPTRAPSSSPPTEEPSREPPSSPALVANTTHTTNWSTVHTNNHDKSETPWPNLSPVTFRNSSPNSNQVTVQSSKTGVEYQVTQLAARQIQSYHDGNGLIINIHVTHHAGTTFCATIGHAPGTDGAPKFACMGPRDELDEANRTKYPRDRPWRHDMTETNRAFVRHFYHMISWEFGRAPVVPIMDTDFENDKIVSVYISRDPISRLLAGDGWTVRSYPDILKGAGNESTWWEYARGKRNVDNYALAVLAGNKCCNGNWTDPKHLETAKKVLDRFTFILDIECLDESLQALADVLGIALPSSPAKKHHQDHSHLPLKDRIPYPEVYEYLAEKNRLSIELHEYAKSRSFVNCSKIADTQAQAPKANETDNEPLVDKQGDKTRHRHGLLWF